jgi:hypothetical protein
VSALAGQQRLTIVPCDLARANAFVRRFHRHHQPMPTHKFSLAVHDESGLVRGVAIVMRPAARLLDNGYTAEVARLATDGCPNACSALYGAAWRAARAMGYRRMTTYILDSETGVSLRGWRVQIGLRRSISALNDLIDDHDATESADCRCRNVVESRAMRGSLVVLWQRTARLLDQMRAQAEAQFAAEQR